MKGLGAASKGTVMGGETYPCVHNVLLGGGVGGSVVQIVITGHVGGNDKDVEGNLYKLLNTYHS